MSGAPRWAVPAYNAIVAWWILGGIWNVLQGTVFASKEDANIFGIIIAIFGAITALVGLGLILRIDLVRGIVNILCFLRILGGIRGLIIGFFLSGPLGMLGIGMMIASIIDIGTGGFMIYLIGETETRAPNF
jgi:hypothetical protein